MAGGRGALGERFGDVRVLAGRDEHIGEQSPRPADELAHVKAAEVTETERERAHEALSSVRDVDGKLAVSAVVAPPLEKPGVE